MKPIIMKSLAALFVVATPVAADAQRPTVPFPQPEQRPPVVRAPVRSAPSPSVESSPVALIAEARRTPRIAPLSPEVRAQRAKALLGTPTATLTSTITAVSANAGVAGVELTVHDAALVDVSHGYVHAWVRPAEILMDFPDGFAGRYVFDCPVWGTGSFSWSHGSQKGAAQVVDHHGLFVIDLNPQEWVSVILKPQGSLVSWVGCEIIRVD
jgi:hypothetical protein